MPKKRHTPNSSNSTQLGSGHRKHHANRKRNLIAIWIGIGVLIVFAAALLLLRPSQTVPIEITAAQTYEKSQSGAFFLDVRTQDEWDQGHIAKSVLIPLDELPNRLGELPRDQEIVVVCRSGARSKEGAAILQEAGFTQLMCLNGGMLAWAAAGYPIEH